MEQAQIETSSKDQMKSSWNLIVVSESDLSLIYRFIGFSGWKQLTVHIKEQVRSSLVKSLPF